MVAKVPPPGAVVKKLTPSVFAAPAENCKFVFVLVARSSRMAGISLVNNSRST
jgi:hypothetical protein